MFGKNEIVGLKHFKNELPLTLNVTSRFYTIQGEGPYRGYPAFFVRLAKCNLACSFCDTYFDRGDVTDFDKIFSDADALVGAFYRDRGIPRPDWSNQGSGSSILLVLTGGEPMLQRNIGPFLDRAIDLFGHTQIESNGTIDQDIPARTTLVVSPKCLEKNGRPVRYLEPKDSVLERADCLKFVISSDKDSPYNEVPEWAHQWHRDTGNNIFVSPMNMYHKEPEEALKMKLFGEENIDNRSSTMEKISFWTEGLLDRKANQLNHEYAAEYAMKHGFILNLQTHLYASLP